MKTTIAVFAMLTLTIPVYANPYCDNIMSKPHDIFGHNNAFVGMPFPKGCKLTKGEQKTKEFCKTIPEGERGRGCWAYGLR